MPAALPPLGAKAIQVSTGSPKLKPSSRVEVMTPSVGELELGVCNVVGNFDSLLDTIEDEAKLSPRTRIEDSKDSYMCLLFLIRRIL
jgi:hypothetical protein